MNCVTLRLPARTLGHCWKEMSHHLVLKIKALLNWAHTLNRARQKQGLCTCIAMWMSPLSLSCSICAQGYFLTIANKKMAYRDIISEHFPQTQTLLLRYALILCLAIMSLRSTINAEFVCESIKTHKILFNYVSLALGIFSTDYILFMGYNSVWVKQLRNTLALLITGA